MIVILSRTNNICSNKPLSAFTLRSVRSVPSC